MTEPDKIPFKAISAQDLLMRANQSNSKSDADSAVREWEALASLVSREHVSYEPILASYAVALLLRWELGHRTNDLRKAIVMLEKALASLPDTASKNRYQNLANLGSAYMDRYETTREDRRDLSRAIDAWEEAYSISKRLNLVNQASSKILPHLADAYFYAYEDGSIGVKGLEYCIDHSMTILERGKPEDRHVTQCKMGQYYAALYSRDRMPSDLNAAIDHLKMGLKGKLRRETRRWTILELSRALSKKYEKSRNKEHLDSAIQWSRIALQENPDDVSILRMFGNLCYWSYKESEDASALDESIECYQKAWTLYQIKRGLNMATFYYSYGSVLLRRYERMESMQKGNIEDVERAIELLRLAVRNASSRDLDEFRRRLRGAIARRRDSKYKGPQIPRSAPLVAYTILPQELDRLLAKGKVSVLVLDARPRTHFEMERIDHDAVVCLEPTLLTRPSIKSSVIESSLSSRAEQALFDKRSTFDVVVMHDEDSVTIGPESSPLSSLFRSIFNNDGNKPLKQPPKLLIGGLKAWKEHIVQTCTEGRVDDPSTEPASPLVQDELPPNSRFAETNEQCVVCIDEPPFFPSRPPTSLCSHPSQICLPCLQSTIQEVVHSGIAFDRDDGHIMCPSDGCDKRLNYEDIKLWAEQDVFEEYDRALLRHELVNDPQYVRCLNTKCDGGQLHYGEEDNPIVICFSCGAKQCFHHQIVHHQGFTCKEWDERAKMKKVHAREDDLSRELIKKTTKTCPGPNCGRKIEKNYGCDHFQCKRPAGCGFEFCWECLAPWEPIRNFDNSRHYKHCNYYSEPVRDRSHSPFRRAIRLPPSPIAYARVLPLVIPATPELPQPERSGLARGRRIVRSPPVSPIASELQDPDRGILARVFRNR